MAGERRRLVGDALHHATIARHGIDAVGEHLEARFVVAGGQPFRRDGHADAGGHTLPERPGRRLDARGPAVLRVAGAPAVELAEPLDVVEGYRQVAQGLVFGIDRLHAGQMQEGVEQHRGVTHRENETIPVRPDRMVRIEAQMSLPERVGHRRHRHGRSGVAGVRLLHRVHGQGADAIHGKLIEVGRRHQNAPGGKRRGFPQQRRTATLVSQGKFDNSATDGRSSEVCRTPPPRQAESPGPTV